MVGDEVRGMRVLPLSDIKEGVTETDEGKQYMGAKNTENMTWGIGEKKKKNIQNENVYC